MTPQLPAFIKDHLHMELNIPIRCRALNEVESESCSLAKNLNTFHLLEFLEEHSPMQIENIEKRHDELSRLEQKMDLLLALMGQLLEQQNQVPAAAKAVISQEGVCWQEKNTWQSDSKVQLELYLNTRTNPLCFTGRTVLPITQEKTSICCVKFDQLDLQQQECFEKWLFRQHRRAIAQNKHRL